MQRLRVGVLGLGAFGESHLRAWRGLPNATAPAGSTSSAMNVSPCRFDACHSARSFGDHHADVAPAASMPGLV